MKDTTPGQKQMARSAGERIFLRCRTFNEIMTGPNPLTKDEIRALIEKYPGRWGMFHAWALDNR